MKWVLGIVAAIVVLAIAALAAVPFLVDTPRIQGYIANNATQALGRPVKFSSVSLRVLPLPAVVLHDLEVAEDPKFGTGPFLKLKSGRIRVKLLPLLSGRVELGDIVLDKPVVTVVQAADGRLNISTLGTGAGPKAGGEPSRPPGRTPGGGGAGAAMAISRVSVDDGVVTYVARGKGGAVSQYRLEGLDVTVTGGATQLAFKGDATAQPGALSLKISDGTLGLTPGRPLTDAALRGKVAVEGKDIKDLAVAAAGPSPQLGGSLKAALTLGGTVGAPTATGEVQMTPLTVTQSQPSCPQPKQRTLTVSSLKLNAGWQDQRLTGHPLTASLGDGTVSAQLTVTLGRGVHVKLGDLGIKALPLEKVLVDYLCEGYAITGPLDLTGGVDFDVADMLNTLNGPGQLKVGRGKVVGSQALALIGSVVRVGGAISALLQADLPHDMFNSPLEFESITGTYQITNGTATTKDLLYTSRAMKVLIAGDYGLGSSRMNLDMTVTHNRGDIKAKITGTTSSPSVRVAPSSIIAPEKAEKGIQDLLKRFKK
ncbi:MAG TPA: AsmA family protein [Methylomirabilota bacterium]|nr:AsmA family protein [Methylomirabilota bacterium]